MDEDSFSDINLDAATESFYYSPQPTSVEESHTRLSSRNSRSPSLRGSSSFSETPCELSFDDERQIVQTPAESIAFGNHKTSIVDGLLFELYDRCSLSRRTSFDSETYTECSSLSDACNQHQDSSCGAAFGFRYSTASLAGKGLRELQDIAAELSAEVVQKNARLIRYVRSCDRTRARQHRYCDIVTAILQAASEKRSVDSKMRFGVDPPIAEDDTAFSQWKDAVRAAARLPTVGLPQELRRRIWLALSKRYIQSLHISWSKTVRFAFNEKSNPDDDALGLQIVKDLHRTGCGIMSRAEAEDERASLRRVLLAYARWNKAVGYCQGFNILASLLLDVTCGTEDEALLIMIYLVDGILPSGYFAQNLRALSVDMAVFRSYMHMKMPALASHLDYLQVSSKDATTGTSYEPPLTNVFTMQWFLTMFATCLPRDAVLRLWDAVLLDGSEMLVRAALAIWSRLARSVMKMKSADEFYVAMGSATHDMLEGKIISATELIKAMYEMAPYPLEHLDELREKLTYNIAPLRAAQQPLLAAADDSSGGDDGAGGSNALACFRVMPAPRGRERSPLPAPSGKTLATGGSARPKSDVGMAAAERQRQEGDSITVQPVYHGLPAVGPSVSELERQYRKLKERQRQAHIIILAAHEKARSKATAAASATTATKSAAAAASPLLRATGPIAASLPVMAVSPVVINHLFVGRQGTEPSSDDRSSVDAPEPAVVPQCPRLSTTGARGLSSVAKRTSAVHDGPTTVPSSECALPPSPSLHDRTVCSNRPCSGTGGSDDTVCHRVAPTAGSCSANGGSTSNEGQTEFKKLLVKGLREGLFKYTTYADDRQSPVSGAQASPANGHVAERQRRQQQVASPDDDSSSSDSRAPSVSASSSSSSIASVVAASARSDSTRGSSAAATACSSSTSATNPSQPPPPLRRRSPSGQSSQDDAAVGLGRAPAATAATVKQPLPANGRSPVGSGRSGHGLDRRSVQQALPLPGQGTAAAPTTTAMKAFNPFPVDPRVLSARKVAHGARLGLYPPQHALINTAAVLQQQRGSLSSVKASRSTAW